MSADNWADVDRYITDKLLHPGDPFAGFLTANAAAGLPAIDVSPAQGKFLHLLARIAGARRILEIGTLGGYSTAWLASALPADGKVTTLEYAPRHAEVAAANLASAGLAGRVEIKVGPALDTLPGLTGPFDLVFIDADKPNNASYLRWALKLAREGTVVVLDNAIRHGGVVDAKSLDPSIRGSREAFDLIASEPRLDSTALQTVGAKGWDGFVLARVKAPSERA
jgi:predicted O-methyltransferase YrrM